MRAAPGLVIGIVDGIGTLFNAVVESIGSNTVRCSITGSSKGTGESPFRTIIAVGLLKNPSKLDFIVEKAVELGVSEIVPLITERTIPTGVRRDRLQQLALAAMKQSGRCVLPTVSEAVRLREFLALNTEALRLIPHEETETPMISDALRNHGRSDIVLCIGPEGGFTREELAMAAASGFIPVSLGPRRLRSETAAILSAGICSQLKES
jgi:16S rRNA (uracil1498-N3)-methyltransferase